MKHATIKCYSAEEYDKTKNNSIYIKTFGNKNDLDNQQTRIKNLMMKRNQFYRNGIPTNEIDEKIPEFKNEVENMTKKRITQDEILPLIKTKKCPDFQLSGDADTFGIFGSSRRGKSNLMKRIYNEHYKNKTDVISILISPSCNISLFKDMKDVIKINKFNSETDRLLRKLFFLNNKCQDVEDNKGEPFCYKFFIMIDDCISKIRYQDSINFLILCARNLLVSSCVCLQYCFILSKAARSSLNNAVFFGQNNDESIEGAVKCFLKSTLTEKLGITQLTPLITEFRRLTDSTPHSFLTFHPITQKLERHILEL